MGTVTFPSRAERREQRGCSGPPWARAGVPGLGSPRTGGPHGLGIPMERKEQRDLMASLLAVQRILPGEEIPSGMSTAGGTAGGALSAQIFVKKELAGPGGCEPG